MKRFFQKIALYSKLPEMRLFWFFLPFLVALFVIDFIYLPQLLVFAVLAILLVLGAVILVNNLRLARSNLEVKIERNELRSIIANLKDGVIAYDPNFKILIFNRAAEEIFGLKANEVLYKYFAPETAREPKFKLLSQAIFPSLAPLVVRRSEPGEYPQIIDISFNESDLSLRVATDKISDLNGQLLGFVKIVRDRTREIKLLKSKTEFIATASHQLRTPATATHWAIEELSKQKMSEEQKPIIETALGAVTKLMKTINDMLDVSKIEEGEFGYQFENVEFISFVEDIIRGMEPLSKQFNVKIYLEKPADQSIALSIDRQKISMVLSNLLDNAVKYNVANGEVIVKIERLKDEPYLEVSVKDTGVGVPEEDVKKLFTKFFRSDNAVKFATEGSGLGLYIAKNIINRHGGKIWAESEINRGSTFHFTLPTDPKLIPSKEIVYGEE
ncbi:MAG: ATP-binding protein [Candidatus Paceibacterota bacterium]